MLLRFALSSFPSPLQKRRTRTSVTVKLSQLSGKQRKGNVRSAHPRYALIVYEARRSVRFIPRDREGESSDDGNTNGWRLAAQRVAINLHDFN
jgi:hypothetical protein